VASIDTGYTISKVRTALKDGASYIVASSYEGTVLGIKYDGAILCKNALSGLVVGLASSCWRRPNDLPEVCRHYWAAPSDPCDDYHVYAWESTPEEITWYIDGKLVARERSPYWHLPMSVTLTLELRPPFIEWAGVDGREPVPEATTTDGLPTEMLVDYVRVWRRD
jgi:hypothetical protein